MAPPPNAASAAASKRQRFQAFDNFAIAVYHTDDTICALASAPGPAARSVIRLSGPATLAVVERVFRGEPAVDLASLRTATVVTGFLTLDDPPIASLPADVYLWPTARSYTRQIAAEIHTVGSPPLASAVVQRLCAAGARLALPGEFTLRAFLAGRLDLTQAEAVLGVIEARGEAQLQTALGQLAGGLTRPLDRLRGELLDLLAHLEAGLDFAEEDLPFISAEEIDRQLRDAQQIVDETLSQLRARSRRDQPPRVVLVGAPNAGKSSLFNALVEQNAALVSDVPGTTRDYLTALVDLDGVKCELTDTAGIEDDTADRPIDALAQRLSGAEREHGDVRLVCIDASDPPAEVASVQWQANPHGASLVVWTKCDRLNDARAPNSGIATSARTGLGLVELRQSLREAVQAIERSESAQLLTSDRCEEKLRAAGEALARAQQLNAEARGEELIAVELRLALDNLGHVAGTVVTDDILDRVFSRFCIGK